jgi:hypothetical protein
MQRTRPSRQIEKLADRSTEAWEPVRSVHGHVAPNAEYGRTRSLANARGRIAELRASAPEPVWPQAV